MCAALFKNTQEKDRDREREKWKAKRKGGRQGGRENEVKGKKEQTRKKGTEEKGVFEIKLLKVY